MTTVAIPVTVLNESEFEDDARCQFTGCTNPAAWHVSCDCPSCGFKSRVLSCDPCKKAWMAALAKTGTWVRCRKCDSPFVFNGTWRPV